jgi:hypothetical protein
MRGRVRAEAGQATAEWVGVVLVVALGLGALAGLRPAGGEERLGEALAQRISGTVLPAAAASSPGPRAEAGAASWPATASWPAAASTHALAPVALRPTAPAVPPWVRSGALRAPSGAKLVAAFRTLRGAGKVLVRRAWIVCLGYGRFQYELKHPRLPNEAMPLEEAVEIANGCLNPYAFVGKE